jgi:tetratricopeptide (TPR) repeat protein
VTALAGASFGIVGALAAFPRRLAAREVERRGGRFSRAVTRGTSHVVFGRKLLDTAAETAIAARAGVERAAGRQVLGEGGFLRLLGLLPAPCGPGLARAALVEQSGLAEEELDLLCLFDAFEQGAETFSFRDLILARKYAGLIAGGASWGAIARSVHRSGAVAALTAQSLQVAGRAIYARRGGVISELDGQLLLGLGGPDDAELEELFAQGEAAEAAGEHAAAALLYQRCLALDPRDSAAAFNRANCLRAAGRHAEAAHDYARALKLDPGLVEAWFNLAGLMRALGRSASARRHLRQAIAVDPDYADAVFNLASLEFEAGNLAEARRLWERYLELDADSEWARTAARGVRFVASRGLG